MVAAMISHQIHLAAGLGCLVQVGFSAHYFQAVVELPPCPLCGMQRIAVITDTRRHSRAPDS